MTTVSLITKLRVSPGRIIIRQPFTYFLRPVLACTSFLMVRNIFKNYLENPENVVVIHCNAGKGRTGTLISCYLIYCGLAESAKDAITYYGWKRFRSGRGVTQPSQLRYVYYFDSVYKRIIKSPALKSPHKIILHTIPDVAGNTKCKPYVEIINGIDFS